MITTPRLLLRPFVLTDVPKLFAMSQEADMRRWIPDQVYRDERHAEQVAHALIAYTADAPDPRVRPYVLGVELVEPGSLIGHVGLSPARGSVEIGYAIEECLCGRGLATEAVAAVARWGVTALGLSEVLGIVESDNRASCRVLDKAGFVPGADEPPANGRGRRIVYRYPAASR
ncbi:MAG TPA: GNAT family N-acetyltransferase [Kofleriaceae bacterium]|nr:GNAT family N-acetyltransferase [Kofleriaceae bacterium]